MTAPADDFHPIASVGFPSVIDGRINDPHIDSERVVKLDRWGCFHVTSRRENPFAAHEHQIHLPLRTFEPNASAITASQWDTQASGERPNGNSILACEKAKDALIVRLCGVSAKHSRLVLGADLKGIRNLGDAGAPSPERRARSVRARQYTSNGEGRIAASSWLQSRVRQTTCKRNCIAPRYAEAQRLDYKSAKGGQRQRASIRRSLGFDVAARDALRYGVDKTGVLSVTPECRQARARTRAQSFPAQNATRPYIRFTGSATHSVGSNSTNK